MKKGDLKVQAIGLAVAGVLAGSRLLSALPKDASKGEGKKSSAGDEKKDKAQASSDKHVCKGMNSCKGKGGCMTDANACAGKNDCKGKGGCATAKHDCKGKNDCKAQGKGGKNDCKGKGDCSTNAAMKK